MLRRWSIVGAALALLMLMVVPAAAGPKGTDRPFKADLVGEIELTFSTDCGSPVPPLVTTRSTGTATHMGRVEANWEHCAGPPGGGLITNGELTMIAANGDELVLVYGVDEPTPPQTPNSFEMDIDHGTGRFADAEGTLTVTFVVEQQFLPMPPCEPTQQNFGCLDFGTPWPWSGTIEGMISY